MSPLASLKRLVVLLGLVLLSGNASRLAHSAEQSEIDKSIERAKTYLLKSSKAASQGTLACYALVKAGVDKMHPDIQKCVQDILQKCQTDKYAPSGHHNYEAGVDAMLLEAVDHELYKPQLEKIAKYLVNSQRPHGGWYYPAETGAQEYGDTSISQYAILGLWAAVRAGVEVPIETWEKAGKWLLATQRREGGFGYHPTDPRTGSAGQDMMGTMGVAGTGSMLIVRHILFRDAAFTDDVRPQAAASGRRFGVLERHVEEKEKAKPARTNTAMTVSTFDKAVKEGVKWVGDHFADGNALSTYENYYFYGVERVAALLDLEKLGSHDWYHEGASHLLKRQASDGSWNDSCGAQASTALTLLFLTKATAGSMNRAKRAPAVGGGLLVGGRGLPSNLNDARVKNGEVETQKPRGSVDALFAELEKSSGAKVEETQEAIVESVQLDNPEVLIGQVTRLKKLAVDQRVEVRRTAMWALGRTGDVKVAPLLIDRLNDPDEAVAREASTALCTLSRRPDGVGWPPDPTEGLPESATDEQRISHWKRWRKESRDKWQEWYLKVRPYDERDDRNSLRGKRPGIGE